MPNWIKSVMKDDGVDTMTPTEVDALNSQYISTLLYCCFFFSLAVRENGK